ncbi:EamA family transporter [Halomonas binhaiensis]|uniref:EamA family transporter n=1 Tax=Halomonas binhaiensis TaxID=2562282 RepID=A0A5C1NHG5_9GAMM|nr:EamA family transporter [Halomonas binhaiensis]QEM82271.1 EamA family transporter [Halomonas binhaiensis]
MSIFISLIAMICLGITHFINGMLSRHYDVKKISFFTHIGGFLIALIAALAYSDFTLNSLYWGALSGIASALGAIFLYRGMSTGAVSVVVPLSGVSMVVFSLIISILFLGERIGLLSSLGLVFSIPAIMLMTWSTEHAKHGHENEEKRSGVGQAVFSGFGFACQLVTLGEVSPSGALAAVAVSMFVASIVIFPYANPSIFEATRRQARIAMFAGSISALGLVLYTIAKEGQLLIISVLIVSMYPLVPVVLGVVHLKERVSSIKVLGIVFSISSIIVLTLGSVGNV